MSPRRPKVFVLDTNVILHDSSCIFRFQENDVVVPMAVLEELDRFKKGSDSINYHARQFVRSLDALRGEELFNGGLPLGEGLGRIAIRLGRRIHDDLALSFESRGADMQVLNAAYTAAQEHPDSDVVLVTKDVNLRMKARAVGLRSEDFTSDHVKDVSVIHHGHRVVQHVPGELIDRIYGDAQSFDAEALSLETPPQPNEYLVLRNGRKSALGVFEQKSGAIRRVGKTTAYGIVPRNAEQTFALDALLNPEIPLVSLSGKAGTGKTLLALAAALERRPLYRQIFLARPIVPLSNKDIGFLPGDITSKLDPFMQPLFDNLGVIRDQYSPTDARHRRIGELLEEDKLVIAPLSYIRGRSLVKIYFIVDEAQNLTPHEVKTIITRAGENTKVVFTGDVFQIDHPYLDSQSNGLSYLVEKMRDQPMFTHVNLEKGERSALAELASNVL